MNKITRILIWVTSMCSLDCKWCSHKYTRTQYSDYQMQMEEVRMFVDSCKARHIHFDVIELTGGEASLWDNLEEGIELFKQVSNDITLVTNGNNPDRIINLNLKHWIVSSSQASSSQLLKYEPYNSKINYNSHQHKKPPTTAVPNSLPANCCVLKDVFGRTQDSMLYLKGKVYYCCNAFPITEYINIDDEIVCDFEDDFVSKMSNKSFTHPVCQYCICNVKVWERI